MVARSVLKFGGPSISDFTKIKRTAEMLKEQINQGEQLIVVISAIGNTTDQLMTNVSILTKAPRQQKLALLLTAGEQQTVPYLSAILNDIGMNAKAMTGYQAGIKTIGCHLRSKIAQINPQMFEQAFQENDILIVTGFQSINKHQELITLGRGGSDTVAVALAVDDQIPCEIYTDVDSMYATDPRFLPKAKRLDAVSYEEMMGMNALGVGVLETRSIELARNYNIPSYLGETLSDVKGTWAISNEKILGKKAIIGVASDKHTIHAAINYPLPDNQLFTQLFAELGESAVSIDMISQIVNLDRLQLSFMTKDSDFHQISMILETLKNQYEALTYKISEHYVEISLVDSGMRDMSDVASKTFLTLIEDNIPFYWTTISEISVSYVIDDFNGQQTVEKLYDVLGI